MSVLGNRLAKGVYVFLLTLFDALAISTIVSGAVSLTAFFHYYILIALNLFGIVFFVAWGWPVWWATVFVAFCWFSTVYFGAAVGTAEEKERKRQDLVLARAMEIRRAEAEPRDGTFAVPTALLEDMMRTAKEEADRQRKAKKGQPGLEEEGTQSSGDGAPEEMYR
jgi:hypothetical protein